MGCCLPQTLIKNQSGLGEKQTLKNLNFSPPGIEPGYPETQADTLPSN